MKRILVFHPIIAPYRIDFFNFLSRAGIFEICLKWKNLHDQTFDYAEIEKQFDFKPTYLEGGFVIALYTIIKKLNKFKPDIVFVSECGFIAILVVLFCKLFNKSCKIISMIDDSYDMLVGNNQFSKKHAIAERFLIPQLDNVITIEPRVSSFFQQRYGKGVCFPIIVDENKARQRYERVLPISKIYVEQYKLSNKRILLFVGRLVELKNLQRVIPIVKNIEDPDLRFVIVGSGCYETELKTAAKDDSRIIFAGRYEGDELYAWYNIAHYLILPSFREAFGAVTNEALLAGCRAIVSNRAGSSCLIKEDINGCLISPMDSQDIELNLRKCLSKIEPLQLPLHLRQNLMDLQFAESLRNMLSPIL